VRLMDVNLEGGVCRFNVLLRDRKTSQATYLDNLLLPMPGHHNALNATAAITVAYQLGLSPDQIRKALAGFGGVKRRFTKTGEWNGVTIFDDYAHHPVEVAAVLRAARASTKGKVVAVVQPHRYTRLQSLFDQFATCFNDADAVIVADVYPAGEQKIEGVDRDHLVGAIKAHGHRRAIGLPSPEVLPAMIREIVTPGDYVVFLGAGNITQWAYALPEQLEAKP
jgi:UDP-N-acetylmuramate--alanine ligase